MFTGSKHLNSSFQTMALFCMSVLCLLCLSPAVAQAGNVGWAVSVGGVYGGGYGGGWRPAAYGPGWGAWRSPWNGYGYGYPYAAGFYSPPVVYSAPPVVTYYAPSQPMVLAAQPQPPVWYFCEASGQYFPYVQSCSSGWQTQPAMPPSSKSQSSQGLTQ